MSSDFVSPSFERDLQIIVYLFAFVFNQLSIIKFREIRLNHCFSFMMDDSRRDEIVCSLLKNEQIKKWVGSSDIPGDLF